MAMQKAVRGTANPLDALESKLHETIFGQDRAIEALLRSLNRARFGFSGGHFSRPRACLLFLGPTGVGKSECAKRVAEALHPNGGGFLKVDCSLFSHGHEVSALVGAPPSYVGRDQKPLFDPEIVEKENSIVLFDEVEKGHFELWNLLLQIMEDGQITLLNSGRTVNFRQSIVIMTTNVGAKDMVDFIGRRHFGFQVPQESVERTGESIYKIGFNAVQKVFNPEWVNRLDEIIAFRPLGHDSLSSILDRMLREANDRYLDWGVYVELTPEAKEHVMRKGFDPKFGARPLRGRLLKDIESPLADLMASGGIPEGSRVMVDVTGEAEFGHELEFFFERTPELEAVARKRREARGTGDDNKRAAETPDGMPAIERPIDVGSR